MLQRKQTLFLLLAVLCGALTYAFPIAAYVRGDTTFTFRTTGLFTAEGIPVPDASPKVPFAVVIGLCMAVFTAAIFFYKKRQRQMRVVRSGYLVVLAVVAFLFITDRSIQSYLGQGRPVTTSYGVSAFLPIAMLVLAFLAERGIRKDEELIKSMDRLR